MYVRFVTNLQSPVRTATLEGRDYFVAPTVMLTEGVWEGTHGPILYLNEENAKYASAWDHKPAVVYHPEMNGEGVSACSPEVLEQRKVGLVLHTQNDTKLRTEVWIDKLKSKEVDQRVYDAAASGKPMEVSTGLNLDLEMKPGVHNGKKYIGIARNYRPDHLAILPDRTGACSIADGAGMYQLNHRPEVLPINNEQSYARTRDAISTYLREMQHEKEEDGAYAGSGPSYIPSYVVDVYSKFVICEDYSGKLWKLPYKISKDGSVVVSKKAAPVEVKRYFEYQTMDGEFVGNGTFPEMEKPMAKKDLIDKIIQNSGTFKEEDRKWLDTLDEDKLTKMSTTKKEETPPPTNNQPPATPPAPAAIPLAPAPQPQTTDQYLATLPTTVANMLRQGIEALDREIDAHVAAIIGNVRNRFPKEYLTQLGKTNIAMLRDMAALATPDSAQLPPGAVLPIGPNGLPVYTGAWTPAPVGNVAADKDQPVLEPSNMWAEDKKSA